MPQEGKTLSILVLIFPQPDIADWKWNTSWSIRGDFYFLDYMENPSGRQDANYTLATGLSRKFGNHWVGGLSMNYTLNHSNLENNSYKKFIIMNSWNFSY